MGSISLSIAFLMTFSIAICDSLDIVYQCPTDDPDPCKCTDAYGKVVLECYNLRSHHELKESVWKMAGRSMTEMLIRESNISFIPRDIFKHSPASRIRIKDTFMFYLFDRELENAASALTEILLHGVKFEGGLDWNVLDNLIELRSLSVVGSDIEQIPYSLSELTLPIETLVLQDNYIHEVHEEAFRNLKDLRNLVLRENFLKTFKRSMLPQSECKLQFLDLSHNRLSSLPDDLFHGLPDLHSLLLTGNHLAVIESTSMAEVFAALFLLDLNENPLLCDCQMTWILSDKQPLHLRGQCTLKKSRTSEKKDLQDLTRQDFAQCFAGPYLSDRVE